MREILIGLGLVLTLLLILWVLLPNAPRDNRTYYQKRGYCERVERPNAICDMESEK